MWLLGSAREDQTDTTRIVCQEKLESLGVSDSDIAAPPPPPVMAAGQLVWPNRGDSQQVSPRETTSWGKPYPCSYLTAGTGEPGGEQGNLPAPALTNMP